MKAAEGAAESGGSPLAPILGTVAGIVLVAIAAFSSNAASAEAYEASKEAKSKEEAKTKVEAGEHTHTCPNCLRQFSAAGVNAICLACQHCRYT